MALLATESRGLTDRQKRFVEAFIQIGDISKSAELAGYSGAAGGYQAMSSPSVQRALHEYRQRRISIEGATLGLSTMIALCDEKIPSATRYQAAKYLMTLAGHVEDGKKDDDDTPLHEMTPDQLRAFIARVKAETAEGADPPVIKVIEDGNAQPGHYGPEGGGQEA